LYTYVEFKPHYINIKINEKKYCTFVILSNTYMCMKQIVTKSMMRKKEERKSFVRHSFCPHVPATLIFYWLC